MNIDTIKNGYVIDHITAGNAMKIYNLLELNKLNCQVAIITNAKSSKKNIKDIIKIGKLIDIDMTKLAYIDPNITLNIVRNDKVIEKKHLELPKKLINVCKCENPRCITSIEKSLDHIFILTDKLTNTYRCVYCETRI